jgi:signal transduction histidine kinase
MKTAIQMLAIALEREEALTEATTSLKIPQDRITQYLRILERECDRNIVLINSILELEKLGSGIESLDWETINLETWLCQAIEPFTIRTCHYNQTLSLELPEAIPPVTTIPLILERILVELLHNACKFTPSGEQITVSVIVREESVELKVTNTGVEIPVPDLPRIFNKFYRVPSLDWNQQGGTGLGLALVQKLSEHLSGCIQVESTAKHTCFMLELPR